MRKMCSESAMPAIRRTLHGPAMGTRWSVTLDASSATGFAVLESALAAAVRKVDEQMSPWKPDSDLNRLNHAPLHTWVALPAEILTVLARAREIARLSGGAFDPTVGALVDAWGFGAAREAPDPAAIAAARSTSRGADYSRLELDLSQGRARRHAAVQLDPSQGSAGMRVSQQFDLPRGSPHNFDSLQIDLCGIAKGFAVDQMVAVLRAHGVRHALAALDGELRALGAQADGTPWPIALESPQAGVRTTHGVIELEDMSVATSGDYRRFWLVGDARLAHTMDPRRTGPVRNEIASVTVLANNCMDADAWATALLVAGPAEGPALARRMGLEALFLLRRPQGLVELGLGRFGHEAPARSD